MALDCKEIPYHWPDYSKDLPSGEAPWGDEISDPVIWI